MLKWYSFALIWAIRRYMHECLKNVISFGAEMAEYHYATEFHIEDKTFTQDLANPDSSEHQKLKTKLIDEVWNTRYYVVTQISVVVFLCVCDGNIRFAEKYTHTDNLTR